MLGCFVGPSPRQLEGDSHPPAWISLSHRSRLLPIQQVPGLSQSSVCGSKAPRKAGNPLVVQAEAEDGARRTPVPELLAAAALGFFLSKQRRSDRQPSSDDATSRRHCVAASVLAASAVLPLSAHAQTSLLPREVKKFVQDSSQVPWFVELQWERFSDAIRPPSTRGKDASRAGERVDPALAARGTALVLSAAATALGKFPAKDLAAQVATRATALQESETSRMGKIIEEIRRDKKKAPMYFETDEEMSAVRNFMGEGPESVVNPCFFYFSAVNEVLPSGSDRFKFARLWGRALLDSLAAEPTEFTAKWQAPLPTAPGGRNAKPSQAPKPKGAALRAGSEALLDDLKRLGLLSSWKCDEEEVQEELWEEDAADNFTFSLFIFGDPLVNAEVLMSEQGQGVNCDAVAQTVLAWLNSQNIKQARIDSFYSDVRYSPDPSSFMPNVVQLQVIVE